MSIFDPRHVLQRRKETERMLNACVEARQDLGSAGHALNFHLAKVSRGVLY